MLLQILALVSLVGTGFARRPVFFSQNDTLLILLDHQTGLIHYANSTGPKEFVTRQVVALTQVAKTLGIPVIIVTALENEIQGPTIPELQQAAPQEYAARIRRNGIINSWNETSFVEAVRKSGKQNILMCGITTEIAVVAPAISMAAEGYNIKVIADAGGSETMLIEQVAWQRLQDAGVEVITMGAIVAELVKDSSGPNGAVYAFMAW